MMDDLTPLLSRLPEPMPPSTLTATVMARIEREAERKANAKATAPVTRELHTWLWTFAGVAVVLVVFVNGWLSSPTLPNFTSARIGLGHAALMPVGTSASLLLAFGLVAYLAGLFAPLRSGGRE